MAKTKSKKDKRPALSEQIARTTLGVVVRVGDALEAVAVAAASAPPAASAPGAPAASPVPPASPPAPSLETLAGNNEPASSGPVAVTAVSKGVEDGPSAIEAIEAYATLHNLQAVDMPSRGTLVDALTGGMARHGSKFTDADVRLLLDEQTRMHSGTLGARTGASPVAEPQRVG